MSAVGLEHSGVWYCRNHHGLHNEDEPHERPDDFCPWRDDQDDYVRDGGGNIVGVADPCGWTELLYTPAPAQSADQPGGTDG